MPSLSIFGPISTPFVFVGLTYLVSYLLVLLYSMLGGTWTMPGALVLGVVYMFVPMTVALVVQKFTVMRKGSTPTHA